jgi:glycosyltransferase involved in cell wall biosynthesis
VRVALLVSSLAAAGAERWNANLANLLNAHGVKVTVLTYRKDKPDFYKLDVGIERGWADFSLRGWMKIRALRQTLAEWKPDVVIASGNKTNIRALLAGRKQRWKTIVVEHNDPSQQPIGWKWELARAYTYRYADILVSISRGVDRYFWFLPQKIKRVIPNTFPDHQVRREDGEHRQIIAIGRLASIKGFDRLVEAFARILPQFPEWTLTIWGEGPERVPLTALSEKLGVSHRFRLPGLTEHPMEELARSDLLVLPSRSEGFGNVLIEAMSVAVPVIAFDCPSGPRDIVDATSGILVPNGRVDLLAEAMASLLANRQQREALGAGALERAQAFSPKAHIESWLKVLDEVTTRP